MTKPIIGAQLYTVREFCKTIEATAATLKRVRDIGYTAVQLSGVAPMKDAPEALAGALRAAGLF